MHLSKIGALLVDSSACWLPTAADPRVRPRDLQGPATHLRRLHKSKTPFSRELLRALSSRSRAFASITKSSSSDVRSPSPADAWHLLTLNDSAPKRSRLNRCASAWPTH